MLRLDPFLLYARRGQVDVLAVSNGYTSTGPSDPAESSPSAAVLMKRARHTVEIPTELADEVGGLQTSAIGWNGLKQAD